MAFPCLNLQSIACIFWRKNCKFNVDPGCSSYEEESEQQRDADGKKEGENRRTACILNNLFFITIKFKMIKR